MIVIDLAETTADRRDFYGITHVGVTAHDVTGSGLHNRHHAHRVQVWDNTNRDRDRVQRHYAHLPGRFCGPDGKPTDSVTTFVLSAEATIISDPPTRVVRGEALTVGGQVQLRYPDGTLSEPMTITARQMKDPELIPTESDPRH